MWIVMKAWKLVPEAKQPATKEQFNTRAEAEAKIDELAPLFPDRIFTAEEHV